METPGLEVSIPSVIPVVHWRTVRRVVVDMGSIHKRAEKETSICKADQRNATPPGLIFWDSWWQGT